MEEHSNGKVEETQKEETHGNGVETVKELFEEVKAELLHKKDSSSESSSSDEEEEKTEPVEEEELLEPVPEPVEEGSNVVVELEAEEAEEKAIELESEDVVEKEGIEQIDLPCEETETSEVADKKESEDSADVPCVDSDNKAEINTETTITSPIISISNRTIQPTSWRSCCGLFEALRRNK